MLSTSDTFGTLPVVTGSAPTLFRENHKVLARQFMAVLAMGFKSIAVVVSHADTRKFRSEKSCPLTVASPAPTPTIATNKGVLVCEFVSPETVSLPGVLRNDTHSPTNILSLSNGFEMARANTVGHPTQVVYDHIGSNGAISDFPSVAVGHDGLPVQLELLMTGRAAVKPTRFGLFNLSPKPFLRVWHKKIRRTSSPQAKVMLLAKVFGSDFVATFFNHTLHGNKCNASCCPPSTCCMEVI